MKTNNLTEKQLFNTRYGPVSYRIWFAWYPVKTIHGNWTFMKKILKMDHYKHDSADKLNKFNTYSDCVSLFDCTIKSLRRE